MSEVLDEGEIEHNSAFKAKGEKSVVVERLEVVGANATRGDRGKSARGLPRVGSSRVFETPGPTRAGSANGAYEAIGPRLSIGSAGALA